MLDEVREFITCRLWEIVTACTGGFLGVKDLTVRKRWGVLALFAASLVFAFAATPPALHYFGVSELYRPIALFVAALVALRLAEGLRHLAGRVKDINLPGSEK